MVGKTKYLTQVILSSTGEFLETFRNRMTAKNWLEKHSKDYFEKLELKQIEKEENKVKSVVTKKKL